MAQNLREKLVGVYKTTPHTLFVAKEKKHLWINYVIDTPHGNIYDADLVLSKMLIFLALWRSVSHYTVAFQKKVVIRNTRILYIP